MLSSSPCIQRLHKMTDHFAEECSALNELTHHASKENNLLLNTLQTIKTHQLPLSFI